MFKPTKIIVHCSDSNPERTTIDDIRAWHLARGWRDIGYHWVINPGGAVLQGRREAEMGAHCQGDNEDSLGICLIGRAEFTDAQFVALRMLVADIQRRFDITNAAVFGHRDRPSGALQGKTCPNFEVRERFPVEA